MTPDPSRKRLLTKGHREHFYAFVSIESAIGWRLEGRTLREALLAYAVAACPDYIKSSPTPGPIRIYGDCFCICVIGPEMERLIQYTAEIDTESKKTPPGPIHAEWIRLSEGDPWILRAEFPV